MITNRAASRPSRKSRADQTWPKRSSSTPDSTVDETTFDSGSAAEYTPWTGIPTAVLTNASPHAAHSSRRVRANPAPAGQMRPRRRDRRPAAPARRRRRTERRHRRHPPWCCRCPTPGASRPARRPRRRPAEADPTVKVKAPWIGWASADVTRHVTMKPPSSSFGQLHGHGPAAVVVAGGRPSRSASPTGRRRPGSTRAGSGRLAEAEHDAVGRGGDDRAADRLGRAERGVRRRRRSRQQHRPQGEEGGHQQPETGGTRVHAGGWSSCVSR